MMRTLVIAVVLMFGLFATTVGAKVKIDEDGFADKPSEVIIKGKLISEGFHQNLTGEMATDDMFSNGLHSMVIEYDDILFVCWVHRWVVSKFSCRTNEEY